ncbi:hypothetical protein L2E82_02718 [Cichorium intybus]|uniref:Uncharacterized protein n=1 Tax=Cichorium intybus TaxID=13427 RepID=A0ACB9H4L1_CICIN|nr:hypothetical protein L2E82_02718 [Cichorium intybus]
MLISELELMLKQRCLPELELMLKQKMLTTSETQRLIAVLRTIKESSSSVVGSRVHEDEITSPVDLAKA